MKYTYREIFQVYGIHLSLFLAKLQDFRMMDSILIIKLPNHTPQMLQYY